MRKLRVSLQLHLRLWDGGGVRHSGKTQQHEETTKEKRGGGGCTFRQNTNRLTLLHDD